MTLTERRLIDELRYAASALESAHQRFDDHQVYGKIGASGAANRALDICELAEAGTLGIERVCADPRKSGALDGGRDCLANPAATGPERTSDVPAPLSIVGNPVVDPRPPSRLTAVSQRK
jgi:hypothetical protein